MWQSLTLRTVACAQERVVRRAWWTVTTSSLLCRRERRDTREDRVQLAGVHGEMAGTEQKSMRVTWFAPVLCALEAHCQRELKGKE